jgi:uncharacterized repeat protein (TIGR01451 family)
MLEPRVLLTANGADTRHLLLAVTATEEYTAFFGTRADAQAAIETTVAGVNKVFNRELNLQLDLIDNLDIIFGPGNSPDPFPTGGPGFVENQTLVDTEIGSANYDIGIIFGGVPVGLAVPASAGIDGDKAKGFTGFTAAEGGPAGANAINNALHEMGHQFAALHTFNGVLDTCGDTGQRNAATAVEPGSGTTIAAYAGICGSGPTAGDNVEGNNDFYYHAASLDQIIAHLESLDAAGVGTKDVGVNTMPTVSAGPDFTIPAGTPFRITATGSDADDSTGKSLRYAIEQMDLGPAQTLDPFPGDNGSSPLFRSFPPAPAQNGGFVRTFPQLSDILAGTVTKGEYLPTTTRELNFHATVRDGVGGTNGDDVKLMVVDTGSPFAVTSHNTSATLTGGLTEIVTWDVAGTDSNGIDTSTVNILLSTDGGSTFPHLLANTPNDGSHSITVPNLSTATARIKVEGDGNIFFDISDADLTITADPSAAGVSVTDSVFVGEGGEFSPETDTYSLVLNTTPTSPVEITVATDGQTEVSTDGSTFATSVSFTRSDTTAQTITIRAINNSDSDGARSSTIHHSISASADSAYPLDLVIDEVIAEVADNEQPPLIGVDFQPTGLSVPRNWTEVNSVSTFGPTTLTDLIREDGSMTTVDLTLTPTSGTSTDSTADVISPLTAPIHTPDLVQAGGGIYFDKFFSQTLPSVGLTATWSGLMPGERYNVYVMATEMFGTSFTTDPWIVNQTVTITGDGSDDPAPFLMNSTARQGNLLVNEEEGDDTRALESFAKTVTADSSGEIHVDILRDDGTDVDRVIVSGLAIQEVGEEGGALSGVKFDDINGSGTRAIGLQGSDPHVVFVIDISGSTDTDNVEGQEFGGTSPNDQNNDGNPSDIIDAEIAAFKALNAQLANLVSSSALNSATVSIVSFSTSAQTELTSSGPDATVDNALSVLQGQGQTNYEAALTEALSVLTSTSTIPSNANVVFLSDGFPFITDASDNEIPQDITDEVAALTSFGANLRAFGAGDGARLDDLLIIDPEAVIFNDTDSLTAAFQGVDADSIGEPGVGGITIFLDLNNDGMCDGEPTTTTNPDGSWSFPNAPVGTYTVREKVPPGTTPTTGPFSVTVTAGSSETDLDFGNFTNVSLGGVKYHDLNENGVRDSGEPPIEGVTILLDIDGDFTADQSTTTGSDGSYQFTDIGPSTMDTGGELIPLVIGEIVADGFRQTAPASISYSFVPLSGSDRTDLDFGNVVDVTATKTDELSIDTDLDGLADSGDRIKYTVTITNNDDVAIDNVSFSDTPDSNTSLVNGSVTSSTGDIITGNGTGQTDVLINLFSIAAMGEVTIMFEVDVDSSAATFENQGAVSWDLDSLNSFTLLTDDPDVTGFEDPTVTDGDSPLLNVMKVDSFSDVDGNGPDDGDEITYTITFNNPEPVTGVVFTDFAADHPNLDLVVGSVTSTQGTIDSGNGTGDTDVIVSIGDLDAGGGSVSIEFTMRIDAPTLLPESVQNQGHASANENTSGEFSDDPDTAADNDPTVTDLVQFDFGDALDSYTTLLPNGPRHRLGSGLFFGTSAATDVDPEADGIPSTFADGDDLDAQFDEGGISGSATAFEPLTITPGTTATAFVTASASDGLLDAFVDFNDDGDFEDTIDGISEQIFSSESLNMGSNTLTFSVPASTSSSDGVTFGRWRISSSGGLSFDGEAMDGEVEDHSIDVSVPVTGALSGTKFRDDNGDGVQDSGEPGLPGFVIFLDENDNGVLDSGEQSTTTASDGSYQFSSLPEGSYIVREVQQVGFRQTTPNDTSGSGLSATGSLQLIQPSPSVDATFFGRAAVSTDGLGTDSSGTLQAEIPAGSTVEFAFLHVATRTGGNPPTPAPATGFEPPEISFEGQLVPLIFLGNVGDSTNENFETGRADVTAIVAAKVGSGGGITNFTVDETSTSNPKNIEGTSLTVIYSNPSLSERTIAILEGGLSGPTPQTNIISLGSPIDTSAPDFIAEMALGIQFGVVASSQFSTIDVNGNQLTSSAGDFDDSAESPSNGNLVTVGGVGDSTDNPADPSSNTDFDDELYNLAPLLTNGATEIRLDTANPSDDDSIFLVALTLSGQAGIRDLPGACFIDIVDSSTAVCDFGNESILDFGDAQDPFTEITGDYPTLLANDGARHVIVDGAPFLGTVEPDAEPDGQPNTTASGDDFQYNGDGLVDPGEECDDGNMTDGDGCDANGRTEPNAGGPVPVDDEEAVDFSGVTLVAGKTFPSVTLSHDGATGGAMVNAWIDWNRNGIWESPAEQVITDLAVPAGASTTDLASLSIPVPANLDPGTTFVRLRVDTDGGLAPTGLATDGEVEDHPLNTCGFVVNSTGDNIDPTDKRNTLREAITCANNSAGLDTITFNIPGSAPHTIRPDSQLPAITDPVIIDGESQTGWLPNTNALSAGLDATLPVEIDGRNAGQVPGLLLVNGSTGSTIRGLTINRFGSHGIEVRDAGNMTITGNFIGTNPAGDADAGNGGDGIFFLNSSDNTIGGDLSVDASLANLLSGNAGSGFHFRDNSSSNEALGNIVGLNAAGDAAIPNDEYGGYVYNGQNNRVGGPTDTPGTGPGNVISGNIESGVEIESGDSVGDPSSGNFVQGNIIGLGVDGMTALGNQEQGVSIVDADANTIGGPDSRDGNVISANAFDGVLIETLVPVTAEGVPSNNNVIQNNLIGTAIDGTTDRGNSGEGVRVVAGNDNRILDNTIAFNSIETLNTGVVIASGVGNVILGNSIHSNVGLGIDLMGGVNEGMIGNNQPNEVTPNDSQDPDSGANNLQNFPTLTSATNNGTTVIVGTLNSLPGRTFLIEFFSNPQADPSGFGEGHTPIGTTQVVTDAVTGDAAISFSPTMPTLVPAGQSVTATATLLEDGTHLAIETSEFSNAVEVQSVDPVADLEVTKVVDDSMPNLGDQVTFTVTLTNQGPDDATNVMVSDTIPAGLMVDSITAATGTTFSLATWTIPSLPAAAGSNSVTLTIVATVTDSNVTITNTAEVEASDQMDSDSTPGNNVASEDDQDSAPITVPPVADLKLDLTVDDMSPTVGQQVTFTLMITNEGPDDATNVDVSEVIPPGLSNITVSPGSGTTFDDVSELWSLSSLPASANNTATLLITANVDVTTPITNTAQVTASDQTDPDSTPGNSDASEDDQATVSLQATDDNDGSISGTKFEDINGDTIRNTGIITGTEPDIVFVIDISGSTSGNAQGTAIADFNADGDPNDIIDAEIAGFIALNNQLIADGLGSVADVSIVTFASSASQLDVDPTTNGFQLSTSPSADTNMNGVPDVEDVLRSLLPTSATNFAAALQQAIDTITTLGTTPENGNVVFLSDGDPNTGGAHADEATTLRGLANNVRAFGVGTGSTLPPLQEIDANAERFTTTDELLDVFSGLGTGGQQTFSEPGFAAVTVFIDTNNNGMLDVDAMNNPTEPFTMTRADDPATTDIDETGTFTLPNVPPGTHTVCEIIPAGFIQTAPGGATMCHSVQVGSGEGVGDIDFGNQRPTGENSIAGFVYADVNNNGIKDPAEQPLPNVPVTITGPETRTVTTAADGSYLFAGLASGTYTVSETQPAAFLDGLDTQGSPALGSVENDRFVDVNLDGGVNAVDYNFGERGLAPPFLSKGLLLASTPDSDQLVTRFIPASSGASAEGEFAIFTAPAPGTLAIRGASGEDAMSSVEVYDASRLPVAISHNGDEIQIPVSGETSYIVFAPEGESSALEIFFEALTVMTTAASYETNPDDPLDVNGDGFVSNVDALFVINWLNRQGQEMLLQAEAFLDPDGDNHVSPADVLVIINRLNLTVVAEGEGTSSVAIPAYMPRAPQPPRPLLSKSSSLVPPQPAVHFASAERTPKQDDAIRDRVFEGLSINDEELRPQELLDSLDALSQIDLDR